jgi:GNAT superfamily N-acetyltransferase
MKILHNETMITIKIASEEHAEILALLGRITYTESHGQFIENKTDLLQYNNTAFAISTLKQSINNPENQFYIIYVDDLPMGFAKLILNVSHENVASDKACRLDKLYILDDFIPLKIGQQFLDFIEDQARELSMDTIWLATYIKNYRAIKFYQKNDYLLAGEIVFSVNGKGYENHVFSKKL